MAEFLSAGGANGEAGDGGEGGGDAVAEGVDLGHVEVVGEDLVAVLSLLEGDLLEDGFVVFGGGEGGGFVFVVEDGGDDE